MLLAILGEGLNIDAKPPRCTPPRKSLTTAFIYELVWAANQVEHLTDFEKRRLLERAVVSIREMRYQVGIPESKTEADPLSPCRPPR